MKHYDNEYLDKLPLLTHTNHYVYSDGKVFYKKSKDDASASKIVLEAQVNEILHRDYLLLPGPPVSIVTESLGKDIVSSDVRESFVREGIRVMYDNFYVSDKRMKSLSNLAPLLSDVRDKTYKKIADRVKKGVNPSFLLNIFDEPLFYSPSLNGLVHSDPRPANWLKSDDGTLLLIDWESAVIAPWEFSVVAFASYMFEYGRRDLAQMIFEEAYDTSKVDRRLLQWCANYRTANTASWYFEYESYDSGIKWVDGLTDLWVSVGL